LVKALVHDERAMWKLRTRDESVLPAIEAFEPQQCDSRDGALQQAWELLYGRTRRPQLKVLWIEGPNGELIQSEEIDAWCKTRSTR
jgi:hypothetical protein